MSAATWILTSIRQNPMIFNSLTGGILCASSDAMAQQMEHRNNNNNNTDDDENQNNNNNNNATDNKSSSYLASSPTSAITTIIPKIDWIRTGSAGIIGMFFGGIVYPKAYSKLDAIWSCTKFTTVIKKSIVEIATVGIFVNSVSMISRGFCRREQTPPTQVFDHVVTELPTVTKNDFFVWMPYNMIAFSIIPAFIRPTTTAFMEASWQTYISLRSHDYGNNNKNEEEDQKETDAVASISTSAGSSSISNQKTNKIAY